MNPADYQVYAPCYTKAGVYRPRILPGSQTQLTPGSPIQIFCEAPPPGVVINSAVVLWPGSVTHHADPNQRLVELKVETTVPPGAPVTIKLTCWLPTANGMTSHLTPSGHYMLFVLSSKDAPSEECQWIRIDN